MHVHTHTHTHTHYLNEGTRGQSLSIVLMKLLLIWTMSISDLENHDVSEGVFISASTLRGLVQFLSIVGGTVIH